VASTYGKTLITRNKLIFLFNKKEKVNLRVDVGFGNDGNSGIYFGIEEAF
jgi:hypothetical protein